MPFCRDCNVPFDKSVAYFDHRKKEHSKFSCPDCGKVFGVRKKLLYHLRGCGETRKNKMRDATSTAGSVISFSNYKRLPVVTAKELDVEFEKYMDRKFGKKGIFRNEKMCKFCCKTFVMASDFADHIRDHYKSIPLDATGVKSKFDFMHFMGLKIREANDTDCSDIETASVTKNKMAECRVVIIGERCKICHESFKCSTDLDKHNKIRHPVKNRNKITLILKIGKEIISRISLRKRHIRRSPKKTGYRSSCKQLRFRLHEMYDDLKCSSNNVGRKHRETEDSRSLREAILNSKINDISQNLGLIEKEKNAVKSVKPSGKRKSCVFRLQDGMKQTEGNTIRCSKEARGREVIVVQQELDTLDKTQNDSGLEELNYETSVKNFELESGRIYADEFFESMQYSEPWKVEFAQGNGSWCSELKSEQNDPASDEQSCYCIGTTGPRLMPKTRNSWEQEHYNNIVDDEEDGNCRELSFHESPPIYKYSCDSKYQADFSFPSDEKSYGFQVKHDDNEETNNNGKEVDKNVNESCAFGYKGAIFVQDEQTHLKLNHSRSDKKPFGYQDLEAGKAASNTLDEYQKVLIKEEVMLEDCTCCMNDVIYPSLSYLST